MPVSAGGTSWQPRCVEVGGWRITALSDGFLRLDGGAMWGVVPRTLWKSLTPPDEDNTILLALRPFLAERDGLRVLLELGVGERWEPKWRAIYKLLPVTPLDAALAACGLEPGDITHVVASHCHWDHIGSAVIAREGRLVPHFPRARHFAPRVEVEAALHPDHVRRASYRADDVRPLREAGLLETYSGSAQLLPGLWAQELGGHSDGVSVLTRGEVGAGAIFWSDVVPTTHHIQPPYIMAYDLDVPRSFAQRSTWLARAAEGGWTGLFYHDVEHAFGRLRRDGKRYVCEPLPGFSR